jgi:DNA-binding transcriptional ArsR family regulator
MARDLSKRNVEKPPPKMVNSRLAAAMSHPTRVGAFGILTEREASPKEIGLELEEPINNVTYHVRQLIDIGLVEPVRTASVRGGRVVEHFYRATRRGWINEDEWDSLGPKERYAFSRAVMQSLSTDISNAMAAGFFFKPDDKHLSRTPMIVDDEGWDEVRELLNETLMKLLEIRAKTVDRTNDTGGTVFPIRIGLLQFRSTGEKLG